MAHLELCQTEVHLKARCLGSYGQSLAVTVRCRPVITCSRKSQAFFGESGGILRCDRAEGLGAQTRPIEEQQGPSRLDPRPVISRRGQNKNFRPSCQTRGAEELV